MMRPRASPSRIKARHLWLAFWKMTQMTNSCVNCFRRVDRVVAQHVVAVLVLKSPRRDPPMSEILG